MASCPNCATSITDDFGLTECANCGAQLLVQIDGSVEVSGAAFEDAPVAFEAPVEDETPFEGEFGDEASADEAAPDSEFSFDAPAEEPAAEEASEFDLDAPAAEPDPGYDFDAEPELAPVAVGNASPDLSDIAAFGNSDASGGRDGALRYNVLVTGIDTADVRELFREALTDRKFLWDTDQILRSIKDGACAIPDLPAVKAHVLITRLRQLRVHVEWEQYAIHLA